MSAVEDPGAELTPAELRDLRRLAAFMVPASAEYCVPGADEEAIFADIVRSLGRDRDAVRNALAMLCEIAVGDFAGLEDATAEPAAMTLLGREGKAPCDTVRLNPGLRPLRYPDWNGLERGRQA
jgi:hypothetical protein